MSKKVLCVTISSTCSAIDYVLCTKCLLTDWLEKSQHSFWEAWNRVLFESVLTEIHHCVSNGHDWLMKTCRVLILCTIGWKYTYRTTSPIFVWNQRFIMPMSLWVHFGANRAYKCDFSTSFRKRKIKEKLKKNSALDRSRTHDLCVTSSYASHRTTTP